MERAVNALTIEPKLVLVDGNHAPRLNYSVQTVIRGDATVPVISAASILAKVARDAEMRRLDAKFPGYEFSRHKGYPTLRHLAALEEHGISPVHRRSFAPVRKLLQQQ